jgi:hypothetical protein
MCNSKFEEVPTDLTVPVSKPPEGQYEKNQPTPDNFLVSPVNNGITLNKE